MLRHALAAAAVLVALSLPAFYGRFAGRRASEALRARMGPGTSWEEVARQLDRRQLLVQWVGFTDASGRDCGTAYMGVGGVQGEFTPPTAPEEKEPARIPMKSHLDPMLTAVARRCPRLSVHSTGKFGFTRFTFEVVLGADGKVASTSATKTRD